jgi:hypothetical protein
MTPRPDRRLEPTESTLGRLLYSGLKDALRELPHLVRADDRLRIVHCPEAFVCTSTPPFWQTSRTVAAASKSRERDDLDTSKLGGRGTGGHQTEEAASTAFMPSAAFVRCDS